MSPKQNRRNLVVVRAGNASIHEKWLSEEAACRNFDIVVSCYTPEAYERFKDSNALQVFFIPGGKWDGIYKTLSHIDIDQYQYFWLADDDIDAEQGQINRIFEVSERYGLRVSQPALRWGSFYSHLILHRSRSYILRYTNFVEIMVPCLHRDVLKEIRPHFENTRSGFGLDYIWCRLTSSGAFCCAIIDVVDVLHTRPLGAELQRTMSAECRPTSRQERSEMNKKFGLETIPTPVVYAGIRKDGEPLVGRLKCGLLIALDYWCERSTKAGRQVSTSALLKHLRRQATKRLSVGPIEAR